MFVRSLAFHRPRTLAAIVLMLLGMTSSHATLAWAAPADGNVPGIAPDVGPPVGLTLVRRVQAGGAQLYSCRKAADGGFAWTLVGPKALLFNDDGSDFGMHTAGPRWTATDGSSIVADGMHPLARVERSGSVPALLLRVVIATGSGVLADVKQVTRTETDGGRAPAAGCDAQHENLTAGTRYTAVYAFYR